MKAIIKLVGVFFVCTGLLSCANIAGRVYFDENGNGNFDGGEIGAANVKLTITNDYGATAVGATNAEGYFSINVKAMGTYYILVDTAGIDLRAALQLVGGQNKTFMFAQTTTPPTTGETTPTAGSSTPATGGTTPTTGTVTAPTTSTVAEPAWTPQGFRVFLPDGLASKYVSIPLTIDFSGLPITTIPTTTGSGTGSTTPGSASSGAPATPEVFTRECFVATPCSITIDVFNNCSCQVKLPDGLAMNSETSIGWLFDDNSSSALLNNTSTSAKSQRSGAQEWLKAAVITPPITTTKLGLVPNSSLVSAIPIVLKPKMICGKKSIALNDISLTITREIKPYIVLGYTGSQAEKGIGTVSVNITNNGRSPLTGDVLVEFVSTPKTALVTLNKNTSDCKPTLGSAGVICSVIGLAGNQTRAMNFDIQLPATRLPDNTLADVDIAINATMKSADLTQTYTAADSIKITLPKPAGP